MSEFRLIRASELKCTSSLPFGRWLLRQSERDDPVGDLARDYKWDLEEYPDLDLIIVDPAHMEDRMQYLGACCEAFQALDSASKEYARYCSKNN